MSRIPRHFHFVFGLREQNSPFHLLHYLCLESCLRVNRPDRVTLYHHYQPYGRYWELIKNRIELVRVPLNPRVSTQHYKSEFIGRHLVYAHHADFIRLEKLVEHGGVYADIDTIFVRPIPDELYEKSFVIGREDPVPHPETGVMQDSLCNALMLAEPGSAFARVWLERMPAALDGSWSNHSCQLAARLAAEFPDLLHIEPAVTFYPYMWTQADIRALLDEAHPFPPGACSVHLWAHLWWPKGKDEMSSVHDKQITADYVRETDTTLTRIARPFLPPPRGPLGLLWDRLREDITWHWRRSLKKLRRPPARK